MRTNCTTCVFNESILELCLCIIHHLWYFDVDRTHTSDPETLVLDMCSIDHGLHNRNKMCLETIQMPHDCAMSISLWILWCILWLGHPPPPPYFEFVRKVAGNTHILARGRATDGTPRILIWWFWATDGMPRILIWWFWATDGMPRILIWWFWATDGTPRIIIWWFWATDGTPRIRIWWFWATDGCPEYLYSGFGPHMGRPEYLYGGFGPQMGRPEYVYGGFGP